MNALFKCFSSKTTNKKKSRKMGPKPTGAVNNHQTIRAAVLVAVIASTVSVIYLYKETINEFTVRTLNPDLSQPTPHKTPPAPPPAHSEDSGVHQIRQKITPKPSDMRSCALFLNDIQTLTLDDFHPIDNQNAKDLTLSQISSFNNLQLGPRIQSIVRMDYFKFVKLNLNRGCTLWSDASKCILRDCSIQYCDESQLPKSVIMGEKT
ncbi:unnamed protein product, partial [Medioppia subpectinata]